MDPRRSQPDQPTSADNRQSGRVTGDAPGIAGMAAGASGRDAGAAGGGAGVTGKGAGIAGKGAGATGRFAGVAGKQAGATGKDASAVTPGQPTNLGEAEVMEMTWAAMSRSVAKGRAMTLPNVERHFRRHCAALPVALTDEAVLRGLEALRARYFRWQRERWSLFR